MALYLMARFNDPIEPMTLGTMQVHGVRSLAAGPRYSIKESRPLVGRCVVGTILIDLRGIVTRQSYEGNTAGECEDEDQCCDVGLHGRAPSCLVRMASNTVTVGALAKIEREGIHILRTLSDGREMPDRQ